MGKIINDVMFWLIVATGISLVVMLISAFFAETQDGGSHDAADDKSWRSSTKEWICNERKIVTAARIVFLSMVTASLIILLGILIIMVILIIQSHPFWWTGVINVVFVVFAAIESWMLISERKNARHDDSLWAYAWFLLVSILLSAAVSCVYFDEEAGLNKSDAVIPGGLIILTAVIASINLLLYIFDIRKAASHESLQWFKRTVIFEIITVIFVFSVVLTPRLKNYADSSMAFEVFFSIAIWEYLKHLWDERIIPAKQKAESSI